MAQTDSEIIERLDKAQLLSRREKQQILKELKAREKHFARFKDDIYIDPELRVRPHYPLSLLSRAKIYSTPGVLSAFMFTPAEVEIEKGKEAELVGKLNRFNSRLREAAFISAKTFQEAADKIKSLEVKSEYELSSFVTSRTEQEYFLRPEKYKRFVDNLLAKEIITRESFEEIMKKSAEGELRSYTDVIKYLKNVVVIEHSKYPTHSTELLEPVYRKTAEALPELTFDSVSFRVEQDKKESFEDFTAYNLVVSIMKDGQVYNYGSFYYGGLNGKENDEPPVINAQEFHQVFNKILADHNSPYRLHIVPLDSSSFAVVPLTKHQFTDLVWAYDGMNSMYIDVSYENFSNRVTQKKLSEAVKLYDSIGLFSHLTSEEKDSSIKELQNKEVNYYSDILSSFKDLVFEIDLEYGVDDGQYKRLTQQLSSISKRHFNPCDIVDTYNYEHGKSFDYGFHLNGKEYNVKLTQPDDWLDLGFWELIEKAVAEQDKAGKFHLIYPNDGMRYIYLTNEQYNILKERAFLEFEDVEDH